MEYVSRGRYKLWHEATERVAWILQLYSVIAIHTRSDHNYSLSELYNAMHGHVQRTHGWVFRKIRKLRHCARRIRRYISTDSRWGFPRLSARIIELAANISTPLLLLVCATALLKHAVAVISAGEKSPSFDRGVRTLYPRCDRFITTSYRKHGLISGPGSIWNASGKSFTYDIRRARIFVTRARFK